MTSLSLLCGAVICGLFAAYLVTPTADVQFVWDDRAAVVTNVDVKPETPWASLLTHDFWGQNITLDSSHKSFRPVSVATLKLDYAIYGPSPFGFRLSNMIIHGIVTALTTIVAGIFTRSTCRAVVAGLLFATHPVHVEAVACVVGRAELVCAVFYCIAILSYCQFLKYHHLQPLPDNKRSTAIGYMWFILSLLLAVFAVFSKENGITLIGVFVLLECLHGRTSTRGSVMDGLKWVLKGFSDGFFIRLSVFVGWIGVVMSYRISVHHGAKLYAWTVLENRMVHMPPGLNRMLTTMYTHANYLKLVLFPKDLAFDWGIDCIPAISGISDPRNLLTLGSYITVISAFVLALQHKSAPALVGLGMAFGTFIPASNVLMWVGTELGERLLYLPTLGLAIAFSCLFPQNISPVLFAYIDWIAGGYLGYWTSYNDAITAEQAHKRELQQQQQLVTDTSTQSSSSSPIRVPGQWKWIVLVIVCALFSTRTVTRLEDWRSEYTVYETGVDVCPKSVKALNNVGFLLMEREELDKAADYIKRAVDVYPGLSTSHMNLGLIYFRKKDFPEALKWFYTSIAAEYETPSKSHMVLAEMHYDMHQAGFEQLPEWAVNAGGTIAADWIIKHVVNEHGWQPTTLLIATAHLEAASLLGQSHPRFYVTAGNVALALGANQNAVLNYLEAVRTALNEGALDIAGNAYNMIGLSLQGLGPERQEEAEFAYLESVRLAPNIPAHHSNLGNFYSHAGKYELALAAHDRAIQLDPNNAAIVNNYGFTLENLGRYQEALVAYERAVLLMPNHPTLQNNVLKMRELLRMNGQ